MRKVVSCEDVEAVQLCAAAAAAAIQMYTLANHQCLDNKSTDICAEKLMSTITDQVGPLVHQVPSVFVKCK